MTFISTICRYKTNIQHLKGSMNALADPASCNPATCEHPGCQVCKFLQESADSVVQRIAIGDVINGTFPLPYTDTTTWTHIQQECIDCAKTIKYFTCGTRPGKKDVHMGDVKRYVNISGITVKIKADQYLLVVIRQDTFGPTGTLTVISRKVLHGILTALHLCLNHLSVAQLR